MRILLLCHSFNSLAQRVFVELGELGHELSVESDINDGCDRLGDLKVKGYAGGQIEAHADVDAAVPCPAQPGDVLLFTSYTVHGS